MEKWQKERLDVIKKILPLMGKDFVLKGGTALSLYYGLDRFSEDIDLDSISENMNIVSKLKNPGYKTWEVNIKKNTETVFRVMIDYGAKNDRGDYPLKIEISSRNKNLLRKNFFKIENKDDVQVYSLNEILKMKIRAFEGRDKIRVFYDLSFYIEKKPEEFTDEMLFSLKEKIDYKDLDSLALLIEDEFTKNKLKNIDAEKI